MHRLKLIKITCTINKRLSQIVTDTLNEIGIKNIHRKAGRSIILRENAGLKKIYHETSFEEAPVDIFDFYSTADQEQAVISAINENTRIFIPGRGSVISQKIDVITNEPFEAFQLSGKPVSDCRSEIRKNIVGICCIVQRNQSNAIVQAILDLGITVPIVTYGEGTGLRDKLGLLRITIPAEKDIVRLAVDAHDAENILRLLISIGQLDKPGKGFIFTHLLRLGLIDTKTFSGNTRHAASIEQIIAALDTIKGNTEWRRYDSSQNDISCQKIKYLDSLAGLTLICNEGFAKDLVNASMKVGAAGATISKLSYLNMDKTTANNKISAAREMSDLIIPPSLIDKISEAMIEAGLFGDAQGIIEITQVPKACTYLGANR